MSLLSHDRLCRQLLAETEEFADTIADADLPATVPTCPDWSLRQLAVHVGQAQRWYEANVRGRATAPLPFSTEEPPEGPCGAAGGQALGDWLAEGAVRLAGTLREAGPDAAVWTWDDSRRAGFWARRGVHETLVHRADAAGAAGREFSVEPEVAADALEEWLTMLSTPLALQHRPRLAELRGPDKSIHLHATDLDGNGGAGGGDENGGGDGGGGGEWLVELGEDGFTWRRGHAKATVALRGPMADVLRVFYRRLPADSDRVEVLGEAELLDFWLERALL